MFISSRLQRVEDYFCFYNAQKKLFFKGKNQKKCALTCMF